MIDFENARFLKLTACDPQKSLDILENMLLPGEEIAASFKSIRDRVIFTDRRVIAVNMQGLTGKKTDYTSLPYHRIQAFSVETAGHIDLDCELELWFSSLGRVLFEFSAGAEIEQLARLIAGAVLPSPHPLSGMDR